MFENLELKIGSRRRLSYILDESDLINLKKTTKQKRKEALINLSSSLKRTKKNRNGVIGSYKNKYTVNFTRRQRKKTQSFLRKIINNDKSKNAERDYLESASTNAHTRKDTRFSLSTILPSLKVKGKQGVKGGYKRKSKSVPRKRKVFFFDRKKSFARKSAYVNNLGTIKRYFDELRVNDKLIVVPEEDKRVAEEARQEVSEKKKGKDVEEEYTNYNLIFKYDPKTQMVRMKDGCFSLGLSNARLPVDKFIDDFLNSWQILTKSEHLVVSVNDLLARISDSNMFTPILRRIEFGERPNFTKNLIKEMLRIASEYNMHTDRIESRHKVGFFVRRKKHTLRKMESKFRNKVKKITEEFYKKHSSIQRQIIKLSKQELEHLSPKLHKKFIKQRIADLIEVSVISQKIVSKKKEELCKDQYFEFERRSKNGEKLWKDINNKFRGKYWVNQDYSSYFENMKKRLGDFKLSEIRSKRGITRYLDKYESLYGPLQNVGVQVKMVNRSVGKYFCE